MSDRLDAIRARLAAATPGPWQFRTHYELCPPQIHVEGRPIAETKPRDTLWEQLDNGNLIANAPADLAYLLDEVDRLREERDYARRLRADDLSRAAKVTRDRDRLRDENRRLNESLRDAGLPAHYDDTCRVDGNCGPGCPRT